MNEMNVFAQPEALHAMVMKCGKESAMLVQTATEDLCLAQRYHHESNTLSLYVDQENLPPIHERLDRLRYAGYTIADATVSAVEPQDWAALAQASFQPIDVPPFYVRSSSHAGEVPDGRVLITMDAGAAFGTGEHATTAGCLRLIAALPEEVQGSAALDLGCGTGILAIAYEKRWGGGTVAADSDRIAVEVTQDNIVINQCKRITSVHGSIAHPEVHGQSPYRVVIANILANPLIAMAEEIVASLDTGGYAILSGFTEVQRDAVFASYHAHGMGSIETVTHEGWIAELLRKD